MADVNKNVVVDRDYSDNFSIKDMALNKIGPKYFSEVDLSALNVGALGFTMEQIANITEDSFNASSLLMNEAFPQHAKIPENIHSHAALFQLNNTFTPCAKCSFIMMIEQNDVIKHGIQSKGLGNSTTYTMYIDRRSTFNVEGIPFTLDYDIIVTANTVQNDPNIIDNYNFSARYDMTQGENCISELVDPYLKIRKTANGYLIIQFTAHQVERTEINDTIISNTKINYPVMNYSFDGELAGFDIFYKAPGDKSWRQLDKALKFSLPLTTDFCYYTLTDENELEISFSTKDKYFQPAFNSELRIVLYTTMGKKGNFETYTGNNITVETNSETFEYNGKITIAVRPMSDSAGGADKLGLDALQALSVEGYSTANEISTETDIMQYFYNYKYRYGTEILVIKRRDDVTERLFSAFLIIKRDNYIFPTNTVHMNLRNEDFDSHDDDFGKATLDAGHTFVYDDNTFVDSDNGDIYRLVNGSYSRFDSMTHLLEDNVVPVSFLSYKDFAGNTYEFGKTPDDNGEYPIYVTYGTDPAAIKRLVSRSELFERVPKIEYPDTIVDIFGNTYLKMNDTFFERYLIAKDADGKPIYTRDSSVYNIKTRESIVDYSGLPDQRGLQNPSADKLATYTPDVTYVTDRYIYFACTDMVYLSSAHTNGYHTFNEITGYIEKYNGKDTIFVPAGFDTFLAYDMETFEPVTIPDNLDNRVPSIDIHSKEKYSIINKSYYNHGVLFEKQTNGTRYNKFTGVRNLNNTMDANLVQADCETFYIGYHSGENMFAYDIITYTDSNFNRYVLLPSDNPNGDVYRVPVYKSTIEKDENGNNIPVSLKELFNTSGIYEHENMNTVKPLYEYVYMITGIPEDDEIRISMNGTSFSIKNNYYLAKFTEYSYITLQDEEYYALYDDNGVIVDGCNKLSKNVLHTYYVDGNIPRYQVAPGYREIKNPPINETVTLVPKPIMVWDTIRLSEAFKHYNFIYTLPFITSVTREPNLAGLYQTVCDSTHSLTWQSDNKESFTSFITSQINMKRSLDNTKNYKLTLSLIPSSSMEQYVMDETVGKGIYSTTAWSDNNNVMINKISDDEYVGKENSDAYIRITKLRNVLNTFITYNKDLDKYNNYLRLYEIYVSEAEEYQTYLGELEIYNAAQSAYNQYLTELSKYDDASTAYDNYLELQENYDLTLRNFEAGSIDETAFKSTIKEYVENFVNSVNELTYKDSSYISNIVNGIDTNFNTDGYIPQKPVDVEKPVLPEAVPEPGNPPAVVLEPTKPTEVIEPTKPIYEVVTDHNKYVLTLSTLTEDKAQNMVDSYDDTFYKITEGEFDLDWSITNKAPVETRFFNDVRVVVGLSSNGKELCYVEMMPEEIDPADPTHVTFSANITSDDHVTSTSTFVLSNIVNSEVGESGGEYIRIPTATLPLADVTANVYILYNFQNDDAEENMFIRHFDDMGEYVVVNKYTTEQDTLEFIKPMNLMRCAATFDNYGDNINPIVNSKIQLLPMVKADTITDDESFNIFINRLTSNYEYMETCLPKLRNNTNIDIKFYNTYGKSINYIIENEGAEEPGLIDRVNISIKFGITAVDGIDETELKLNLKAYIKDFIESVNSSGNNSLYISNLIRGIENNFGTVHHLKFGGINNYDTGYQTIRVKEPNLSNLTKLERREYVPEILVIDDNDINLSITVN